MVRISIVKNRMPKDMYYEVYTNEEGGRGIPKILNIKRLIN